MTRIPVLPTIVVAAAVLTMIALGFWQIDRMGQKEALLAHYAQARTMSSDTPFPRTEAEVGQALYRHATVTCERVLAQRTIPGRSHDGRIGMAQVARCALAGGGEADIALGWSAEPAPIAWSGGEVGGILAPNGREARLVAGVPVAGLAPLTPPDPAAIPNNHLAYAGQWFFFALTALVIYVLALRRRQKN